MKQRFRMRQIQPNAYKALSAMESYLGSTALNKHHHVLIKLLASQLNGCAFCLHLHLQEAVQQGEDVNRLMLLNVWRECEEWFSKEEQAVLALTEAVTLISENGVGDEVYDNCIALFGETYTAQLLMAIIAINSWNRIGRSLNMQPGEKAVVNKQHETLS